MKLWDDFTDLYAWNTNCTKPIVINQGGTYSGKTIALDQTIIDRAVFDHGSTSTITSQDLPNLKRDALREFKALINQPKVSPFFINPKLDIGPYKLYNGSLIEFVCFDSPKDAEGAKRDYLYVNEAPGLKWDIFFELKKRTEKQVFIDYNPSYEFWAHTELMHLPETQVFISTFMDNKFCTEKKKDEILSWYQKWITTKDEYWLNQWRVYGQGKTGIVSGAVFPNIRRISEFPAEYYLQSASDGTKYIYGLDFGYNPDPIAICKVGFRAENDRIVSEEIFYESKVNSFDLYSILPELGIRKGIDIIVADSANMEAIDLLVRHGYRMVAAKKDPGSVLKRIELINKHGLDITHYSNNFFIEQKQYVYKNKSGRSDRPEPVDRSNHLFDSLGYASMYFKYGWGEMRTPITRPQRQRSAVAI